ncbi:MAG: hypothetical protein JNK47_02440 [Mesorhizobium sp.]|nr:hypothetical protein [Mesorhizobium sp.]MBL8576059.1 hypothetical protein [Mesorhizobium sp.]
MQDNLDEIFGVARLPERIDKWEQGRSPESLCSFDDKTATALVKLQECVQSNLLKFDARTKSFLWAIDADGGLTLALEEIAVRPPEAPQAGYARRRGFRHPVEEKKLGHPTLVGGGKARIAGELAFDENGGSLRWVLNANSGRYCKQLPPTKTQIDAAANLFKTFGMEVKVDYFI